MAAWVAVVAVIAVAAGAGCLAIGGPAALSCPDGRVQEVHGGTFAESYTSVVVLQGEARALKVHAELAEGGRATVEVRDPEGSMVLEAHLDRAEPATEESVEAPLPGKWTAAVQRAADATVALRWSC